jgi:hypothetical protein
MGEYDVTGIDVAAAHTGRLHQQNRRGTMERDPLRGGSAAAAAAAAGVNANPPPAVAPAGVTSIGSTGSSASRLRVFSVLPQVLADRAKEWGSCLSLREGWRQTDRGFFDAPGALAAACLVPHTAALAGAAMPPVTMVFAAVEGARSLLRWRRGADAREALRLLRLVLRSVLAAAPGGYLCREQEGDLRYMLAFPDASSALQWCLMVQEALMYAPWPPALLDLPDFAEQRAAGDGAMLFRGPRVKMGVCEGTPRSLVADHFGRADYFGTSTNQAARYMDVAAHGGQVACEAALAKAVFR